MTSVGSVYALGLPAVYSGLYPGGMMTPEEHLAAIVAAERTRANLEEQTRLAMHERDERIRAARAAGVSAAAIATPSMSMARAF